MPDNFRLAFKGSPFLPQFDHEIITGNAIRSIRSGIEPAPSIAIAVYQLMTFHITLLKLETTTLQKYCTGESELCALNLGYQYPIESIMASAVCKRYPEAQRSDVFEKLVATTHDFDTLRAQDQIAQDLRATINLLNKDPSGALVFELLKKYPFSQSEYFLDGMEIAAMIFFGISLKVAHKTGEDRWLNVAF